MNTPLTSAPSLITHIDGNEAPAAGRWTVVPAHTWLVLRIRPGRFAAGATACGATLSGIVDIDPVPERCRFSLGVDTARLTSKHTRLVRALGTRDLRIEAVRTGHFEQGGWNLAGWISGGDECSAVDAWVDYRGVYRRGRDLSYAWLTTNLTVPAGVLGLSGGRSRRRRDVTLMIDVLAMSCGETTDRPAMPDAA